LNGSGNLLSVDNKWVWVYNTILDSQQTELKMNQFSVNDTVSWSSAAGNLEGVITNICLSLNAANQIVPWIDIKAINEQGRAYSVRLCATHGNLNAMRVAKVEVETV
jgi:trehalose/maltose hydrolase-like predicted phosphorylase